MTEYNFQIEVEFTNPRTDPRYYHNKLTEFFKDTPVCFTNVGSIGFDITCSGENIEDAVKLGVAEIRAVLGDNYGKAIVVVDESKLMRVRPHRGTLADSLKLEVEIEGTFEALHEHILKDGLECDIHDIEVDEYGFDERIGEAVWIVHIRDHGVWGMSSELPIPRKATNG